MPKLEKNPQYFDWWIVSSCIENDRMNDILCQYMNAKCPPAVAYTCKCSGKN